MFREIMLPTSVYNAYPWVSILFGVAMLPVTSPWIPNWAKTCMCVALIAYGVLILGARSSYVRFG